MIELDETKIDYSKLMLPFKNIHYRPQTCTNGRVLVLAYLDSRDVMKRLDDVVGVPNWSCMYEEKKGNMYCGISIGGTVKWDCGTESNMDKEKGESSDAFKRSAVKWGIGRYLYYLPPLFVEVKPKGKNWIRIVDKKTNQTLTGYYDEPRLPKWAIPVEPEVSNM